MAGFTGYFYCGGSGIHPHSWSSSNTNHIIEHPPLSCVVVMCRGGVTQGKLKRVVSVELRPALVVYYCSLHLILTKWSCLVVTHWKMEEMPISF